MKNMMYSFSLILLFPVVLSISAGAQETKSTVNVTADFVSSYVWRGSQLGKGPAIQPTVEFTSGKFTLGAWGSYCLSNVEAPETDLYTSLSIGNLTVGLTDYYFPGPSWFKSKNHAFELNGGWEQGIFSLSGNWILNEGGGSIGNDLYFEAGLQAGNVSFFAGAGSGWHTPSGKFNVCNLGISSAREVHVTDTFSLPITGSVILNPASEQFHIVVGITL
jgi:hypothetical protein